MVSARQMNPFEEVNLISDRQRRELKVQVPVRMGDGLVKVFSAYRVQIITPTEDFT